MLPFLKKHISADDGFTLIEIIIVIVVMSIMAMMVAPRMTRFLGDESKNFNLITGIIAKTYDDAFLNDNMNYLAFHLYEPFTDDTGQEVEEVLQRNNAISVLQRQDGKFVDHPREILKSRQFNDSFKLVEVLLSTGEKITSGNVLVPFYPQGYSDNVIVHILINDEEEWSLKIYKHLKETEVKYGFLTFENDE